MWKGEKLYNGRSMRGLEFVKNTRPFEKHKHIDNKITFEGPPRPEYYADVYGSIGVWQAIQPITDVDAPA